MAEIAKRLTFDEQSRELAAHRAAHSRRPLAQIDNLISDTEQLVGSLQKQLAEAKSTAVEQAEKGGQGDLVRLNRQYQTLKNTYVNLDVREKFIRSLQDDSSLHAAHQQAALQQLEASQEASSDRLRALKQENQQARGNIEAAIAQITGMVAQFDQVTGDSLRVLRKLQADVVEHERALPPPPSPPSPGPSLEECQALLERELARAKVLEAGIATADADVADLEAANAAEEHDVAAMEAQVAQLEALRSSRAKAADAVAQYKAGAAWCSEHASVVSKLSGVSVLATGPDALHLQLSVHVPTTRAGDGEAPGSQYQELHHQLSMYLQPGGSTLQQLKLEPAVVPTAHILAEARAGRYKLSKVVREVQTALRTYWRRQAMINMAGQTYSVSCAAGGPQVTAQLPPMSIEAVVMVPFGWPDAGGRLQLLQLTDAAAKRELSGTLEWMQRQAGANDWSLKQLLDATAAELQKHV